MVGLVVVYSIAWATAARRLSLMQLTGYMLWGQFALHMALNVTGSLGGGHGSHAQSFEASTPAIPAWTMLSMHVASALLSAWWLLHGERAFFAFLRFMALTVLPVLVLAGSLPTPDAHDRGRAWFLERWAPPRFPLLRHTRVLRGPPVTSAA